MKGYIRVTFVPTGANLQFLKSKKKQGITFTHVLNGLIEKARREKKDKP